jgi:hypothetical protein
MSCWCGHGPWHHYGYYGPPPYPPQGYPPTAYPPGAYGPPPATYAVPPYRGRSGRRSRVEDLEDYLAELEDELARVREELRASRPKGGESDNG